MSDWMQNTNFEAMLTHILNVAVKNNVSQEDLPSTLLVISDMQFDSANDNYYGYRGAIVNPYNKTLHNKLAQKYRNAGYTMPVIVYWNVNAHSGTQPVEKNQKGAILVSGNSPAAYCLV